MVIKIFEKTKEIEYKLIDSKTNLKDLKENLLSSNDKSTIKNFLIDFDFLFLSEKLYGSSKKRIIKNSKEKFKKYFKIFFIFKETCKIFK